MSDFVLTQAEADLLITLEKIATDETVWDFTGLGDNLRIPLISADKRENYFLDVWSSGKIFLKGRLQNRARSSVILVRVDYGGHPHMNPDGVEVGSPHIHLYKEGMGVKFAFDLPKELFHHPEDKWDTLQAFMKYCNITKIPFFNRGLWS
jgi:hypothetical protein